MDTTQQSSRYYLATEAVVKLVKLAVALEQVAQDNLPVGEYLVCIPVYFEAGDTNGDDDVKKLEAAKARLANLSVRCDLVRRCNSEPGLDLVLVRDE